MVCCGCVQYVNMFGTGVGYVPSFPCAAQGLQVLLTSQYSF